MPNAQINVLIEATHKGFDSVIKEIQKLKQEMKDVGGSPLAKDLQAVATQLKAVASGLKTATAEQAKGTKQMDDYHKSILQMRGGISGYISDIGKMIKVQMRWYGAAFVLRGLTEALLSPFKAAKASIEYLSEMETYSLGIATAFMVGGKYIDETTGKAVEGQRALTAAQQDAKKVIAELQVANLMTIATLDQLVKAYQETLPVAMAKGFNRDQAKEFTVAMVQAAGAIGLNLDMMAEETRSLLTGTINPRTSRIAVVLGLRNEDIRQHSQNADQLFDFLMKKLEAYRVAGIATQNTWKGLMSNIIDVAKQMGGIAFEPLFQVLKYELQKLFEGIVSIDEKTKTIKWNESFLKTAQDIKEAIMGVIAEIRRMMMLIDTLAMVWGDMAEKTGIPGIKGWGAELKEAYIKRYKENEKALLDYGMMVSGFKEVTNPEEVAAYRAWLDKGITNPKSKFYQAEAKKWNQYSFASTPQNPWLLGTQTSLYKRESDSGLGYKQEPPPPDLNVKESEYAGLRAYISALKSMYADRMQVVKKNEQNELAILEDKRKVNLISEKEHNEERVTLREETYNDELGLTKVYTRLIGEAYDVLEKKPHKQPQLDAIRENRKKDMVEMEKQLDLLEGTNEVQSRRIVIDDALLQRELALAEAARKRATAEDRLRNSLTGVLFLMEEERKRQEFKFSNKDISAPAYYGFQLNNIKEVLSKSIEAENQSYKAFQNNLDAKLQAAGANEKEQSRLRDEGEQRERAHYERLEQFDRDYVSNYNSLQRTFKQTRDPSIKYQMEGAGKAIGLSLDLIAKEYLDFGDQLYTLTKDIASNMVDAFSDYFFDVLKGKFNSFAAFIENFLNAVLRAMTNMFAQQATGVIMMGVKAAGASFGLFHSGGSIGSSSPSGYKILPAGALLSAPRLHGGLASDEYPAILQKGETVLPKGKGTTPNVSIVVNNSTGQPVNVSKKDVSFNMQELVVTLWIDAAQNNRYGLGSALGR